MNKELYIERNAITNEIVSVINLITNTKLTGISARVFVMLHENLNTSVSIKELLNYAYKTNLPDCLMPSKTKSLHSFMCVKIRPFAKELGLEVATLRKESIILINSKK